MRFRLKTHMVFVAAMAIVLVAVGGGVEFWRNGGLHGFRRRHAMIANNARVAAESMERALDYFDSVIKEPRPNKNAPPPSKAFLKYVEDLRRKFRETEGDARWHQFLAGPEEIHIQLSY